MQTAEGVKSSGSGKMTKTEKKDNQLEKERERERERLRDQSPEEEMRNARKRRRKARYFSERTIQRSERLKKVVAGSVKAKAEAAEAARRKEEL